MDKVESLYIHFPLCRHLCNYCDFYKTAPSANERTDRINDFERLLLESFERLSKIMSDNDASWSELETLYIGGGTPSLWDKSGARFLENFLKQKNIKLKKDCEATLEVNPGTWTHEGLEAFKKIGFNRFSLGVQSTRDEFLEKLDRVHRKKELIETRKKFQSMEANFSVDFMLGLPFSKEKERNIIEELEEIVSYGPSHLSLYILTVKENYKHFENLPDEDWIEKGYTAVSDFLTKRGFSHYEVSNFSLPGKESKHNSKYWRAGSIAALGPSATGYFEKARTRFKWKTLNNDVDLEVLTESEAKMEKFYLGIRTSEGLNFEEFFNSKELPRAMGLSREWEKKGQCSIDKNRVKLTSRGYIIMDSLMDQVFMHTKSL